VANFSVTEVSRALENYLEMQIGECKRVELCLCTAEKLSEGEASLNGHVRLLLLREHYSHRPKLFHPPVEVI
jgi:hypothetical protein